MIDEHLSTEIVHEDLDDDADDHQTTAILDFPPVIPSFGPPASPARALRRRCVRRQRRNRATARSRHHRRGSSLLGLMMLISGGVVIIELCRRLH